MAEEEHEPIIYSIPVAGDDVELHAIQIVAFAAGLVPEASPRILAWAADRFAPSSTNSGEGK